MFIRIGDGIYRKNKIVAVAVMSDEDGRTNTLGIQIDGVDTYWEETFQESTDLDGILDAILEDLNDKKEGDCKCQDC